MVDERILDAFPGAQVEVHRFSELVDGANDLIKLTWLDRVYALGVVGMPELTVTFMKTVKGEWPEKDIAGVENQLAACGLGRVDVARSQEGT